MSDDLGMVAEQLSLTLNEYLDNDSTFAAMGMEIMVQQKGQSDSMNIQEVSIVLLNPKSYEALRHVLPLMHRQDTRRILSEVILEVCARIEKEDDMLDNPSE
jgi:hypothetical protein